MSTKVIIAGKNTWTTVGHNSLAGTRRTVRLVCAKADAEAVFDAITNGAWYQTLGTGAYYVDVKGYYDKNASSVMMNEAYATLNLIFDSQSVQDLTIGTGTDANRYNPVYNLSTNTEERAIERHPNFLCKWAYNLYELIDVIGGTPSAVPVWADTDNNPAGGTRTTQVTRQPQYLWSRTQPASPEDGKYYKQVLPAEKFGVDTYLIPSSVVTSVIYYTNRNIKNSDLYKVGTLKAPGYTYNISSTSANQYWLITASNVQEATKDLMVVTTSYQYAPAAWDTDIYAYAT